MGTAHFHSVRVLRILKVWKCDKIPIGKQYRNKSDLVFILVSNLKFIYFVTTVSWWLYFQQKLDFTRTKQQLFDTPLNNNILKVYQHFFYLWKYLLCSLHLVIAKLSATKLQSSSCTCCVQLSSVLSHNN